MFNLGEIVTVFWSNTEHRGKKGKIVQCQSAGVYGISLIPDGKLLYFCESQLMREEDALAGSKIGGVAGVEMRV